MPKAIRQYAHQRPQYTARDPEFEMTSCTECRSGDCATCVRSVTLRSGVMVGVYVCQCCGAGR